MNKYIKCVYLYFFISIPVFMQSQSFANWKDSVIGQFDYQCELFPQEKVYAHIDRYFYQPGDTTWFALYLEDTATHQPFKVDQVIYVEHPSNSGRHIIINNSQLVQFIFNFQLSIFNYL